MGIINEARQNGKSLREICAVLEVTPRAYYRWRKEPLKSVHGGGGGWNKLTPQEFKKIVTYAKKHLGQETLANSAPNPYLMHYIQKIRPPHSKIRPQIKPFF